MGSKAPTQPGLTESRLAAAEERLGMPSWEPRPDERAARWLRPLSWLALLTVVTLFDRAFFQWARGYMQGWALPVTAVASVVVGAAICLPSRALWHRYWVRRLARRADRCDCGYPLWSLGRGNVRCPECGREVWLPERGLSPADVQPRNEDVASTERPDVGPR